MACDSEVTVFEKDTASAPKRQDAWKCYGSGGYVEYVDVYNNTEGKIRYKLPLSLVARYLEVTQGSMYQTHKTTDYTFTLECTVVFYGFQSNAIKVQTCIIPLSTPTPTPTPIPQKGSISCITNPSGANVYIDNNTFWKKTNCLVPDVEPGYHKVGYTLPGYKDYVTTIHVAEGQTRVVSVNLVKIYTPTPTPAPTVGTIRCITSPTGATVIHNGSPYLIPTNCTIAQVPIGNQTIILTKSGYQSETVYFYLSSGQIYTLSKTLKPSPTPTPTPTPLPTTGDISCITLPTGANVYIDNNTFWKKTNCLVPDVDVGYHKVGYTLTGYMDYVKTIYLSPGETEIVSTTLVKVPDTASIKATCNVSAYVKMDNEPARRTPYTFSNLVQGSYHTLLFHEVGYISQTKQVKAEIGTTIHVNLVPESAVGFNITVNIPGLSSYQNKKLWVEPVMKIPFTDTWIPSGVHGGITWERVINREYLARDSESKCDPQPNSYFPGSTNHLEPNKDYAVFVGDVLLETFPDHLVYRTGSSTPTNVSVGEDYYDWWMNTTCDLLNISMTECKSTLESGILDVMLSAEDISIVTTGKSIYPPYDQKTPTFWNYLFAGLAFLPVGGTVKGVGKLGPTISAAIKKGGLDLENFVRFNRWKSVRFPGKDITFLEVMWDVKGQHLDEITKQLYSGNLDQADVLIKRYLPMGINPNDCAKDLGTFTKELFRRLPDSVVRTLITDSGLEKSFSKGIDNIVFNPSKPTKESLDTVRSTLNKVPATKTALKKEIKQIILDSDPSVEQVERFIETNKRVPEIVEETIRDTPASTVKNYITKMSDWLMEHPKISTVAGLAIWTLVDSVPFYIWIYLIAKGANPGARSFQGKDHISVIDTYYWNVKVAEDIQNWDSFCENLNLWVNSVDEFEEFIEQYSSTLQNEGTYFLYKNKIKAYRMGIEMKGEIHSCGLPATFTATIHSYIDGDSIKIKYNDNTLECRLLGINTPEGKGYIYSCTGIQEDFLVRRLTSYGKECIEETIWNVDQAMYDDTVSLLKLLLPVNTSVTIKIDKNNEEDKYGRKLVVIERLDKNINIEMLKAGTATVFFYENNSRVDTTEFLAAEKIASDAKYGIWEYAEGTGNILCVSENETACKIWLDGGDTGEKTVNNQFTLTNVLIGNHEIAFTKQISGKDHICFVDVVVTKNQTVEARCSLNPTGTPTPTPIPTCPNPTASFDMAPSTPKDGDNVSLDGTDSSPGTGHWISKFEWILNQVTIGTGIFHSFVATIGDHLLTLKTTNDCGNVDSATKSFSVSAASCPRPTASFVNTPASPEINEYMYTNASDSSGDPGAEIQRYEWYVDEVLVSTGETASFTFNTVGTKSLKLKVINTCGSSDTKTKYITVKEPAACPKPTASFINTPSSPKVNEYMYADASGSSGDATAPIELYEWYVDDVLVQTGMTTSIIFSTVGTKLLKLNVINSCGESDVKTKYISVSDQTPLTCPNPTASFVMSPSSPNINENVTLSASDSKGGTGHSISNYEWVLDGSGIGYGVTQSFSAIQGNHILQLKIKNDCGNEDSVTKTFNVGPSACPNPSASFIMAPTSPKVGNEVIMDASTSKGGSGSFISEYKWYINNVLIGMGKLQSFTAKAGTFILKLEVINECANSDFVSKSFTVSEPTTLPGPTGTIYCRSQNQTACEIWLDNIYTGKKTVSNVYLLEDIPVGPHTVTFKKMIKGVQHTCSVSLTVIENKQAQADCAVSSETVFPIDFKSIPLNAIITKQ